MSDLLPTSFVGTTMAGVQAENGQFRVYYQGKDYELYEMRLNSPDSTEYSLRKLTTVAPAARINTPIAACAWQTLGEVRVFDANLYVSSDICPRDRYAFITSLPPVGCKRLCTTLKVAGARVPPWVLQLRTAPACMGKSHLESHTGSGSSLQMLPRVSRKLIILGQSG
jgi:hypothetical protein